MPGHSWLPGAHASAPSHVSAVMSGVVIKMGVYGLVRVCGLFDSPPLWWGVVLVAVGSLSAFLGVVFALSQHDLKRLLAYHSVENIGIIVVALGLAMVGRSIGRPEWILLGLAACLLHVWNHAIFKSLLFLGAGSIAHSTGTLEIELTGGLARRMPATAAFFLIGAVAICGLPPLNGFVSELFLYLGLARGAITSGWAWTALAAAILAATGALAVACFVKVFGVVFLGNPRTPAAARAREAPAAMLAPMAILALACAVLGAAPALIAHPLEQAVRVWARDGLDGQSLAALAPLGPISVLAAVLLVATPTLLVALVPACRRARHRHPALATWACGYASTSPRVQYTASSFAQIITSRFAWALRPRAHRPTIERLFPSAALFESQVEDPVLDRLLEPAAAGALRFAALMRALPQGQLQRYILYIVAFLIPLLIWAMAGASGAH